MQLRQLSSLALAHVLLGAVLALVSSCGEEEQAECADFHLCAEHYRDTFDTESVDTTRYEEGGTCWDDPLVAEACRQQCKDTKLSYGAVLTEAGYELEECDVEPDDGE